MSIFNIGLEGCEVLTRQAVLPLLPPLGLVIVLGVVQTLLAFAVLSFLGKLGRADAASTAAHYGSVSVGTFAVGANWLTTRGIAFEPQLAIFLTVMEVPAILVGIVLGRGIGQRTDWRALAHETFLWRRCRDDVGSTSVDHGGLKPALPCGIAIDAAFAGGFRIIGPLDFRVVRLPFNVLATYGC